MRGAAESSAPPLLACFAATQSTFGTIGCGIANGMVCCALALHDMFILESSRQEECYSQCARTRLWSDPDRLWCNPPSFCCGPPLVLRALHTVDSCSPVIALPCAFVPGSAHPSRTRRTAPHPHRAARSTAAAPAAVAPHCTMPLVGGSLSTYAPAFSNDDKLLCVPCGAAVKLFSVRTGEAVGVLAGADNAAAAATAPAAEASAAGSAASVRADGSHAGHTRTVTAVMPHPSNRVQLYTASLDGTVKLWDLYDQVRTRRHNAPEMPLLFECAGVVSRSHCTLVAFLLCSAELYRDVSDPHRRRREVRSSPDSHHGQGRGRSALLARGSIPP